MTVRIIDQPNHKHYGPVRRLWKMLYQLNLIDTADAACNGQWENALVTILETGLSEVTAQRSVLFMALTFWEEADG